jgi:uncharacterized phage infection (PIP) family protein YhgE
MDEVVASVKRVTDIMGEITAASHEQSEGIEQVNQAIAQMDQVTQQNAALVEEAAAAAESMQDQAAELANVVSVFKLGAGSAATNVAPVATRQHARVDAVPVQAESQAVSLRPASPANDRMKELALAGRDGDQWEEF